jgi:hypothetical protein
LKDNLNTAAELIAVVIDFSLSVTAEASALEVREQHGPGDRIGLMTLCALQRAAGHTRFVGSVIEDDPHPFASNRFELGVTMRKAFKLHLMADLATCVGHDGQVRVPAPVLLVTCGTGKIAVRCDGYGGRKRGQSMPGPSGLRKAVLTTVLQDGSGQTVGLSRIMAQGREVTGKTFFVLTRPNRSSERDSQPLADLSAASDVTGRTVLGSMSLEHLCVRVGQLPGHDEIGSVRSKQKKRQYADA